jgi:uroporphyrinogen decarboxylase
MNKRERIQAVLNSQPVDRVPAGFWFHFPAHQHSSEAAVAAHLDLYRATGMDFMKVMNEHLYAMDAPIRTPDDWRSVKAAPIDAPFYQAHLEELKRIIDALAGECMVVSTVHGVFASAFHATHAAEETFARDNPVARHLHEHPGPVLGALDAIADSLARFAEACIAAGADGVFYAALGGEAYRFAEEEFLRFIAPYDRRVLAAVADKAPFNILHICKDQVRLHLYREYPGQVVNWGENEQNLSLEEGRTLFQRPILGGMHYRGPIAYGPPPAIVQSVHAAVARLGPTGFILGADCTLPTGTPVDNIRTAVAATAGVGANAGPGKDGPGGA